MENRLKITSPKYQQIAVDVASKIAEGSYRVGDKIYARSSLASQYGVSAETARRAICILSDLNIVDTEKGSGIIITSCENAAQFVRQYGDCRTISELKLEMMNSVERQRKESEFLGKCLSELIEKTERFRSVNPFTPFQITITASTAHINQSVSEINFWHNTSATIIAIKREEELLMSPGPYAVLSEHDVLYFVGDDTCQERVKKFLYPAI